MKFAIGLMVLCLCISFISAKSIKHKTVEKTWGNVDATEFGRESIVIRSGDKVNTHTVTFPPIPSKYPIVGMKLVDYNPPTKVKIIDGKIGDTQITVQLNAEGHNLECMLVFYYEPK